MRGVALVPVLACLAVATPLAGHPRQESAPPQRPGQQLPPVFRGEVDLIRLDVSVLERDRRPVTGLTAADFTILEDGAPQTIAAFTEIIVADRDPKPTAWMRHTGLDVATNDLVDQLGDGRPYAIVMDDWTIPADDLFLVHGARAAAREIVIRLGPSDLAAVVFVRDSSRSVDFTADRGKLLDAIARFEGRYETPEPDEWQTTTPGPLNPRIPKSPTMPRGPSGLPPQAGAVMPNRPKVECAREFPLLPTLELAARRLAQVPNRRKSLVLVTAGRTRWNVDEYWRLMRAQPIGGGRGLMAPGGECAPVRSSAPITDKYETATQASYIYGVAQQSNINLYTIDVSDDQRFAGSLEKSDFQLFLDDTAHYTGGLVVGANGESPATSADRVVAEAGSYYLLGYVSTSGPPDGRFRRLEVRVNRPGVMVRTRSGYFAVPPGEIAEVPAADPTGQTLASFWSSLSSSGPELARRPPDAASLARAGLNAPAGLPLRLHAAPVAPAGAASDMVVSLTLSVRLPPTRAPVNETMTIVRQIYDAKGRPGPPEIDRRDFTVPPAATAEETRYDHVERIVLAPGRHELRLNVQSAAAGRSGAVFTAIEVPDIRRLPLTLTQVVLGAKPSAGAPRTDPLAPLLPIVPTSARSFAPSEPVAAFFQVFQGGTTPPAPVTLRVTILDRRDQPVFDRTETLPAEAFGERRGVPQQVALPLSDLAAGPYLLSVNAARASGPPVRRDVRFNIR
jgi:VWFA-related protein